MQVRRKGLAPGRDMLESLRRIAGERGRKHLGADDAVGTDEYAFAALGANIGLPDGDFQGQVALFPGGRSQGKAAIDGKQAHRYSVPLSSDQLARKAPNEFRGRRRNGRGSVEFVGNLLGNLDPVQAGQRRVDRIEVGLDDAWSCAGVGFPRGVLDRGNVPQISRGRDCELSRNTPPGFAFSSIS